MIVNKIINNNFISTTDEHGHETVLMGKGLGWKLRAGDPVDTTKIEKTFRMDTVTSSEKMKKLFLEVDVSSVEISSKIIEFAENHLEGKQLNKNLILTLTDHIDFAIKRYRKDINVPNDFSFWLEKMFTLEYEVGLYALDIIYAEIGLEMPRDEAGSIALHIINAQMDGSMSTTGEITQLLASCLKIIEKKTGKSIPEYSLAYERFMRHLLSLAHRIISKRQNTNINSELNQAIRRQYPKEYNISIAIGSYILENFEFELAPDEKTFLTIHINRLFTDIA